MHCYNRKLQLNEGGFCTGLSVTLVVFVCVCVWMSVSEWVIIKAWHVTERCSFRGTVEVHFSWWTNMEDMKL